ncbi:MAG: hypothetical protein ACRCXT_11170 [Paraclostridium sp.]
MKTLNIQVLRGKNSTNGNPSFIVKRWDDRELFNQLVEKKNFKECNTKKDGWHFKTKANAGFCYALLNKCGVEIDGILVKATLFVD